MRFVRQESWGFILEHESNMIFVPIPRQVPLGFQMQHSELRIADDFCLIIKATDRPFILNLTSRETTIIAPDDPIIPLIQEATIRVLQK